MCAWKIRPERNDCVRGFLLTELAVALSVFALLLTFLAFALMCAELSAGVGGCRAGAGNADRCGADCGVRSAVRSHR